MPKYYEGPTRCQIALVGEAPGAEEERERRPFVGPAGQLLNRILQQIGLPRGELYIDNVFQERPKNNDVKPWLDTSKRYTVESAKYLESLEALKERLNHCTANVIVALGNTPLYTLTGKKAITKRRGSILESTLLPGRKIIPTIHPSAALHQYMDIHLIAHDLRRVIEQALFPEVKLLERFLTLLPSYAQVLDYIRRCREEDAVAFDIEVMRREVSHLSLAIDATDAMTIPFMVNGENYFTPPQEAAVWQALAFLLEDEKVAKVGQNLAFDSTFLYRRFGIHVRPMHDTMIAQAILFPDFRKGLDMIQTMYCNGEPYYKDDGKEWFRYDQGEEAFRRYSAMDSAIVAEIWPKQQQDLKATGNWAAYERQVGLIEPLVFIGEQGIRMDVAALKDAAEASSKLIEQMEKELWALVGKEINWRSPAQLKNYFYGALGIRPYTKKGSVTTDDKALKRLATRSVPGAELVLKLRHEEKLRGTYYTMSLDDDGRLRCSYNPVGTKQGRISSSKTIFGTGGNLQNQPPQMKALMLADPGMVMIAQDLSQAENRVVAFDAQEMRMIQAFEDWVDIHTLTASMIYGKPTEEITYEERAWGKRANHGLNYDLGFRSFAVYYQITEDEARFIVERYHQIYPGVRRWHAIIRDELNRTRSLTNLYGRKRVFLDRWGHELFKEAYSYIPQSTVAEVMNQWGVRFVYENQNDFGLVQLANTVHDSLIYQIPLSTGWEYISQVAWAIRQNLERPLETKGRAFNIPVDTKIGFNLDEATMVEIKAKEAKDSETFATQIKEFLDGQAQAT